MNNVDDLRKRLFAALDGLADREKPMEVDRARAIADVARAIIDSAKAEIQLLDVTGARGAATDFIPIPPSAPEPRRLAAQGTAGCPSCGGRLKPETNGDGVLVDRCVRCGQSPAPVSKGAKAPAAVAEADV